MRRTYRPDEPFPLLLVFPLIFTALYVTHAPLLRLPYYWDEAGYYIPAALDFFRTRSLIPHSTLSNAHPPLPSIYLSLWWWTSGFAPIVTRIAMCVMSSFALLGAFRLCRVASGRTEIAAVTVFLTALYPVWFAQSTLAHADMFAAAGTLWALSYYLERNASLLHSCTAAACFALACLAKETAVATPVALAIYEGLCASARAQPPEQSRQAWTRAALLLASTVPLWLWYFYHWHETGFVFGNPEYLRYNATSTLQPLRIAIALLHRIVHVTAHMNLFVPVLCSIAALLLARRTNSDGQPRSWLPPRVIPPLAIVLAVNLMLFSALGGALLTRYLLPLYPIVLLFCVAAIFQRVRAPLVLVGLSATAFVLGIFFNPPYRFSPEDNLSYRDMILLHQAAIRQILARYPSSTVLTAWPATDELTRPELGYVRKPVAVEAIDNFSLPEVEHAAALNTEYTTALVFSTKYDPPRPAFSLGPRNEALDRRFFDFHHDLEPEQIAGLLGGKVTWHGERKGEWAAVLHFDRPQLATANPSAHP